MSIVRVCHLTLVTLIKYQEPLVQAHSTSAMGALTAPGIDEQ